MLIWVKEIAMFLIISGLLLEMIAETKYERFVRWVVGCILILLLVRPFAETKNLWERFRATFQSFDYALGSEKVLEEIYSVSGTATQTVLDSYKESVCKQIEQILNKHSLCLLSAKMEVADNGELLFLKVCAGYSTAEEHEEGEQVIRIPTVAPIKITEEEEIPDIVTPMEIYIRGVLAEFYQVEENRIEVEIQEATG